MGFGKDQTLSLQLGGISFVFSHSTSLCLSGFPPEMSNQEDGLLLTGRRTEEEEEADETPHQKDQQDLLEGHW